MSKVVENQLPKRYRDVIDEQITIFNRPRVVEKKDQIPDTTDIPIEDQSKWLKIPDVICVYVDMLGSTRLSAVTQEKQTAGAHQLFTGCAVKLFAAFEAPYIDVRGDGAFALFDSSQQYRALAAAVSFKTFGCLDFVPMIKDTFSVDVGTHIGIDRSTVLVRKLGFKRYRGRSDRQNEVWAGRPVSMAAKLASRTKDGELLASDRFRATLTDRHAVLSCGCNSGITGEKRPLWTERDLSGETIFDFKKAYCLESMWCSKHGSEYCEFLLGL